MFDKFVIISLCFALINTKALVQEKVHNEVEEINGLQDAKNPMEFSQQYDSLVQENSEKNKNEKTNILAPNKKKIASSHKQQSADTILPEIFLKQIENHPEQLEQFKHLEDLLKRYMVDRRDVMENKIEPAVGFGGKPRQGDGNPRIVFGNMTTYVNKAINRAQRNLEQNGRRIYANNPPYVIYQIPRIPITFKLKYIEGASTLTTQGTTMGLHYFNAVYTFNQFKFEKIKYFYEVQIKPMNLFTIRKSLTVVLENARVYMPTAFQNTSLIVQQFEYIKPLVTVECADNMFINYIVNDIIIDHYFPETKENLAEIAAKDTKLLLDSYLKNAQHTVVD